HNLNRGLVQHAVIERFQANANALAVAHFASFSVTQPSWLFVRGASCPSRAGRMPARPDRLEACVTIANPLPVISPPFDQGSPRPDSPGPAQRTTAPSNNSSGLSTTTGSPLRIRTIPRAAPTRE